MHSPLSAASRSDLCIEEFRLGPHFKVVMETVTGVFALPPLLFLSLTASVLAQMKFVLQYQDQFGSWKRWGEKHNEGDAYRTAKARAKATGKRFRIVDDNSNLIDLVTP